MLFWKLRVLTIQEKKALLTFYCSDFMDNKVDFP